MLEWNRSHEYVLQRFFHERAEVILHFSTPTPSVRELVALRRVVPSYASIAPATLRGTVGHTGQHSLGDMPGRDAREYADRAQKAGLKVTVKNTSRFSYLPINKTTGCMWLIEDEKESKAVAESMIAAGVPVEIVEG